MRRLGDAYYGLEASITYQRGRRRHTVCNTDRPSAAASLFAYDRSGRMVWNKTKADLDVVRDAHGAQHCRNGRGVVGGSARVEGELVEPLETSLLLKRLTDRGTIVRSGGGRMARIAETTRG